MSTYILWLAESCAETTVKYHDKLKRAGQFPAGGFTPDRIIKEMRSMVGRPLRGRLWCGEDYSNVSVSNKFDLANDFHYYLSNFTGGIPCSFEEAQACKRLGVVTDLDLNTVRFS